VIGAGQETIGASLSSTVTVNEHEPVFPDVSVALQVTDVVPFGKVDPEAGVHVGVTESQLSVADEVKLTTAEHLPGSVFWVMGAGQVTFGASLSCTVTENEHEPVLLLVSVAEQVTVVVPFGNIDPDAGVQVGVTESQLSVADEVKLTTAEHLPGSVFWVMGAGQVTTGASLS